MRNFYPQDRESENLKGGRFSQIFKKGPLSSHPVLEQEVRMLQCKMYRTRIEKAISNLREWQAKDLLFIYLFIYLFLLFKS